MKARVRYPSHRPHVLLALAAALAASVAALALGAATAQAHAAYKSSTPAANSVLKIAPTVVSITFVQKLSPQGLSITVLIVPIVAVEMHMRGVPKLVRGSRPLTLHSSLRYSNYATWDPTSARRDEACDFIRFHWTLLTG
jgi:hypothetical protein